MALRVHRLYPCGAPIVALCILLMLAACSGDSPPPAPATATAPPLELLPPTPSVALPIDEANIELVAKVNGVGISRQEYERAFTRIQQLSFAADDAALAQTVLDTLIEQAIIEQAAAQMGIVLSESEIDADIRNMATQAGSDEAWARWKRENLYTDDEYRAATRSQLITLRVRDQVVAAAAPVQASSGDVQQVRARHILVSTEAEAQDILARLQNGEDFEALALRYSRDLITRERGGDLDFFSAQDLITPELATVAFGLAVGEVAGPVGTALGYHVIQTLEFATISASPEEQARQQETAFNEWLQAQIAAADVERFLN